MADRTDARDHANHEPATMADCSECRALAYEPFWYRTMREERVSAETGAVVVPEVGEPQVEVVPKEAPAAGVEVPDLEEQKEAGAGPGR